MLNDFLAHTAILLVAIPLLFQVVHERTKVQYPADKSSKKKSSAADSKAGENKAKRSKPKDRNPLKRRKGDNA
ncbi:hypothetical protein GCM10011410_03020 [Hoyosella rhizosphaerae]|uniref:Uncharacterized protein n=1 Tax=Hoyosella rhizosphaerae TaxID=1755582 RepID=A0A916X9N7_9ACTN|nr:hypothetical protein GCM10011410_03020 [Hoyosella rhizosphaerae]